MDENDVKFVNAADFFLRDLGMITDYQKNNLIIVPLMIDKTIKNIEIKLDTINREISAVVYVKFLSSIHFKKKKIAKKIFEFYSQYLIDYKVLSIGFKYV